MSAAEQARRGARGIAASPAAAAAAMAAGALLLLAAVLHAAGLDASRALRALWTGSVGSWYALTSATLVRAVPLALAGLAVALAFRAGVWNIGAEGQLLVGAAAAAAVALAAGDGGAARVLVLPLAVLAGVAAGALWAGAAALLRQRAGVLEVISTIMLNFLALHLVAYLVSGPLQEPLGIYPQTPPIAPSARLPRLVGRLHWGLPLAVALAALLWWTMRATAAGFRLRAAGHNPQAARVAGGIDVARTTAGAFVASGALAGLAGAVELTGVTFALYENFSPGYGYTAIAVALLARLHPLGVLAAAVFFGALQSGGQAMQREAGVPTTVVAVIEALIVIAVLVAGARRARATAP